MPGGCYLFAMRRNLVSIYHHVMKVHPDQGEIVRAILSHRQEVIAVDWIKQRSLKRYNGAWQEHEGELQVIDESTLYRQ